MFDRPIHYSIYLLAKLIDILNVAVFKLITWHVPDLDDEPKTTSALMDLPEDPDDNVITLREFNLGDLLVVCPNCGERDDVFLVGLALSQYEGEVEHFDITTVGMVAYTCGCIVYSACLTDKIATILNASDNCVLTLDMLANINRCDEHGVLHVEE